MSEISDEVMAIFNEAAAADDSGATDAGTAEPATGGDAAESWAGTTAEATSSDAAASGDEPDGGKPADSEQPPADAEPAADDTDGVELPEFASVEEAREYAANLAKQHRELQKLSGRHRNELGELRQLRQEFEALQATLQEPQQAQAPTQLPSVEEVQAAALQNPQAAFQYALENDPDVIPDVIAIVQSGYSYEQEGVDEDGDRIVETIQVAPPNPALAERMRLAYMTAQQQAAMQPVQQMEAAAQTEDVVSYFRQEYADVNTPEMERAVSQAIAQDVRLQQQIASGHPEEMYDALLRARNTALAQQAGTLDQRVKVEVERRLASERAKLNADISRGTPNSNPAAPTADDPATNSLIAELTGMGVMRQ